MVKGLSDKSGGGNTPADSPVEIDEAEITKSYAQESPRFTTLLHEVTFVLNTRLNEAAIKLHGIEQRIKTLDSLVAKCRRKNCNTPFDTFHDIAGARVICLFKDDIDRIGTLIGKNFEVVEIDDKRADETAPVGYSSVHFICKMPSTYAGPRYEKTRNLRFEIQVRTLCMHCWATVSHYLDYKGEWDVPNQLKMSLSALSGLFYVADNEFQQFYVARIASKESAATKEQENTLYDTEINLDTMTAALHSKYRDREFADNHEVSNFVQEVKGAGYKIIGAVVRDLDRASRALTECEKDEGNIGYYSDVGAARISLSVSSESFLKERSKAFIRREEYVKYRHLLKII